MNNNIPPLSSLSAKWLYDSPVNSDVEAKVRRFLVENADKIIGIQVCAYKDGKVIIDTAARVLGIDDDDSCPVQPDSLFPVLSATKGVTSGLVHWLDDKGCKTGKHKTEKPFIAKATPAPIPSVNTAIPTTNVSAFFKQNERIGRTPSKLVNQCFRLMKIGSFRGSAGQM